MRVFNPPSGFTPLHEARNKLRQAMHAGVPASAAVEQLRNQGLDVSDHNQTVAAVELLRKAIKSGDLAVYVDFPLSARPRQLSPELCQIAIKPKDGTVLTFAYIPRHPKAPFDVSWSILNQLPRALLLIEEQRRHEWQNKEKQKKAWPCHAITANTKKGRGRPRRIEDAIEVLKQLDKRGELKKTSEFKSSLVYKQILDLVKNARPSLKDVCQETVRQACIEIGLESARSRRSAH
jgi:hypothetical protein